MPQDIKLWFTIQNIKQFVDRPRQCTRCFRFNHPTSKCKNEQVCVTCGSAHEGPCTSTVVCASCAGPHRADYNQCPNRFAEIEFLHFKCSQFLSFIEARRAFERRKKSESSTFAKIAGARATDLQDMKTLLESRTNVILKIIVDTVEKQAKTINEAISVLSCMIVKFMEREHSRSPERKKPNVKEKDKSQKG